MEVTLTVTVLTGLTTAVADMGQRTQNHRVTADVVGNDSGGQRTAESDNGGNAIPGTAMVDPVMGAIMFVPVPAGLCRHDGDCIPSMRTM